MDNKMDMEKFEKMYDMVKQMKHQSYKMDEMRDSSPIAAFRSVMNFDNNNQNSMDFNKMANFFKNFRSKRQAAGDALALNDRLKEKIQHVFEEQQSKIGNMTCVLREMNCLNAEHEIVTGEFGTVNMGRVKSFMSCCKNAKQKLCMN